MFYSMKSKRTFPDEQEILFSMHSVFRVTHVLEMRKDFWQVNLKLTNDKDEDLIKLTDFIQKEIERRYRVASTRSPIDQNRKFHQSRRDLRNITSTNSSIGHPNSNFSPSSNRTYSSLQRKLSQSTRIIYEKIKNRRTKSIG